MKEQARAQARQLAQELVQRGMPQAGLKDSTRKLREMSRPSTGLRWSVIPTSSNGWIAETLGAKASGHSWLGAGLVMMLRSWRTEALRW